MTITEACIKVRDEILAEMKRRGFYFGLERVIRHDPLPWDINCGYCEEFGERVCELVKGAEAFWKEFPHPSGGYEICHYIVKYRGRFYDAECVEGVKRWRDLPICNPDNKRPVQ